MFYSFRSVTMTQVGLRFELEFYGVSILENPLPDVMWNGARAG